MSHLPIYIASRGHVPRMRAHKILLAAQYPTWFMVVDNDEQAARVIGEAGVPRERVIIAGTPQGLGQCGIAWVREFIERQLVPRGTWYATIDDNISGWTGLPTPMSLLQSVDLDAPCPVRGATWRQLFASNLDFADVLAELYALIAECEKLGTWAGGFATTNNHFFRSRKWQHYGYVRAVTAVWKNTGLPFYYWPGNMFEDFTRTVDVVERCGCVVVNRYVKPEKPAFEEGGIGSLEARIPNLTAVCDRLIRQYPGLLRPIRDKRYSVMFTVHNRKGFDKWHAANKDVVDRTR